jgi:hypothetical protein
VTSHIQNPDVRKIAGELAAAIRKAGVARAGQSRERLARIGIAGSSAMRDPDGPIEHDLAVMRANYDIASAPFASHRPLLGRLIIVVKNIVREFLVQLLARQSAYNGAATRAITSLKHRLDLLADEQARIAQRIAALESRVGAEHELQPSRRPWSSSGVGRDDGLEFSAFDERLDAVEEEMGRRRDTANRS